MLPEMVSDILVIELLRVVPKFLQAATATTTTTANNRAYSTEVSPS